MYSRPSPHFLSPALLLAGEGLKYTSMYDSVYPRRGRSFRIRAERKEVRMRKTYEISLLFGLIKFKKISSSVKKKK